MSAIDMSAFAPVLGEVDQYKLRVDGQIPSDLNGTFVRNGPNPFSGQFESEDVLSWWPEAAMLHGIQLQEGKATSYRNRWVRTKNWATQRTDENTPKDAAQTSTEFIETNPNVNVISHCQEVLALAEGGQPLAIDRNLNTLGPSKRHPSLAGGVTAHPKIDPITGELIYFKADWQQPFLRYGVIDQTGAATVSTEIELESPAMMHDMAITGTYSILLDLSVGYDFSMFDLGYQIPICWQPDRPSRLCLVSRASCEVKWIEIDQCFIQHVVNAYDTDKGIILDVVRYPSYFKRKEQGFEENPLGVLWRYEINTEILSVTETQLDDLHIELPRINEILTGQQSRYCYALEQPKANEMRGIVSYNLHTNARIRYSVEPGDQNGEPVFVPRENAQDEQNGYLLVCVYRKNLDVSELRILDAGHIAGEPIAIIHPEHRIPAGFHGAWLAD